MRIALIIGSAICLILGLWESYGIVYDITKFGIRDRTAGFALIFYTIHLILALAPAILLFNSRKKEISLYKLFAIGGMECIVLLGFLAEWAGVAAGI